MVTTDNTNPAYVTTRFGDAQQQDTSNTYVNILAQQPDTSHTRVNVLDQPPDACILYIC